MRRIARLITFVTIVSCVAASVAHAGAMNFSNHAKTIRAGYITSPCGSTPPNVFYFLNSASSLKPSGWDFRNPRQTSGDRSLISTWSVNLSSITFSELYNYDVLLLFDPVKTGYGFTLEEREKLRKFVDHGGVLWIDVATGTGSFPYAGQFFIPGISFGTGSASTAAPADSNGSMTHPLLCRPYLFSKDDLNSLGNGTNTAGTETITAPAGNFDPIVLAGGSSILSGGTYGSGHVVITVNSICGGIDNDNPLSYELAYNIVNWASESTTFHKDPRHSGYSPAQNPGRMSVLWTYPFSSPNASLASPVIINDEVLVVEQAESGAAILHAFDLSPWTVRTPGTSPDDGLTDLSTGTSYDELWQVNLGSVGAVSTPTAVWMPNSSGMPFPAVFMVTKDGNLIGYDTVTGSAISIPSTSVSPFTISASSMSGDTCPIPAPTYSNNRIYWVDGVGAVHGWAMDSSTVWSWPGVTTGGYGTGSPSIGYVRDSLTGIVDEMLYIPTAMSATAGGPVKSLALNTFNDTLTTNAQSTDGAYSTRTNGNPIKADSFSLYKMHPADGSISSITGALINNNQFLVGAGEFTNGDTLIADYALDTSVPASIVGRNEIFANGSTTGISAGVLPGCTPMVGPSDILYFSAADALNSTSVTNGQLYAVTDGGRSTSRIIVKWKACLADQPMINALGDIYHPVGSPVTDGDLVYFAVSNGTTGYILAFDPNPSLVINVGSPISTDITDDTKRLKISQVDSLNPGIGAKEYAGGTDINNAALSTIAPYVVDYAHGKIIFNNLRMTSGDPTSDLSVTQDLLIQFTPPTGGATQTQTHEPFSPYAGDKWNSMVWYMKLPGAPTASPSVVGNSLYIGCAAAATSTTGAGTLNSIDLKRARSLAGKGPREITDTSVLYTKDMGEIGGGQVYTTPAGSNGVMAVSVNGTSTSNGRLVVYYSPVTLVADSNRLVELDDSGNGVWSCDSTKKLVKMDASSAYVTSAFNKPSIARYTAWGTIIAADTGNNRIVDFAKDGTVQTEITGFQDPNNLLGEGAPLTLNRPTDVYVERYWVDADSAWQYYYLVADSGNHRILGIEANYNVTTQQYDYTVDWTTKTAALGQAYEYKTAQLFIDPSDGSKWVFSVVSNYTAPSDGIAPGAASGAVVRICYDPTGANTNNGMIIGAWREIDDGSTSYRLLNPTFFNRTYPDPNNLTNYYDAVIDPTGIYVREAYNDAVVQLRQIKPHDPKSGIAGADEFETITGLPYAPTSLEIMANGNLLVTNAGTTGDTSKGEIVELTWNGTQYVKSWSSSSSPDNTYPLRQPASAIRQAF